MKQGKWASAIESWSNTMLGFGLSLFLQWAFFAWWLNVPLHILDNLTFAGLMTAVSFARGYAVRRFFERIGLRFKMSAAFLAVMAERARQIAVEGWSHDHDDKHERGVLAAAGACYAIRSGYHGGLPGVAPSLPPSGWPWADEWWKPQDFRRNLIKAAALIIAEIEKFDRAKRRPFRGPLIADGSPASLVKVSGAVSQPQLDALKAEFTKRHRVDAPHIIDPVAERALNDGLANFARHIEEAAGELSVPGEPTAIDRVGQRLVRARKRRVTASKPVLAKRKRKGRARR